MLLGSRNMLLCWTNWGLKMSFRPSAHWPTNWKSLICNTAMATKLGRMVTYSEGLPPVKSNDPLITWKQTKNIPQLLSGYGHQALQGGNLPARAHTLQDGNLPSRAPTHYISASRVPMTTKLGKMVTYLDGLLPIKSHDPLIAWPCKVRWQT